MLTAMSRQYPSLAILITAGQLERGSRCCAQGDGDCAVVKGVTVMGQTGQGSSGTEEKTGYDR